jgi:hypothetical protein
VPVTPGLLVVVLAAAAAAAFGLRYRGIWTAAAGFAGLGLAVAMAAGLDPASSSTVFGLSLAASPYARLAVMAAAASIAGVAVVAEMVDGGPAVLYSGLVAGITAVALALFSTVTTPGFAAEGDLASVSLGGPAASVLIVAAATALLAPFAAQPGTGVPVGGGWLKVASAGAAVAAIGVLWPPLHAGVSTEPGPPDASGAVVGLLMVAAGLALRGGAFPLQRPFARLITATRIPVLTLAAIWLPAVMALAAVSWSAAVIDPLAGLVPPEGRNAAAALGVTTLLFGGAAAAVQWDVRRLLAWSIVGDAGLLVLLIVPEGPALRDAARTWLLVNAVARTALAAWVMALGQDREPESARPSSTRGWVLGYPVAEAVLLLVGLVVTAAATYGLPGWPGFEARRSIIETGVPQPFSLIGLPAAWFGLLAFVRLAVEGVRTNPQPLDTLGAVTPPPAPVGSARGQFWRARRPVLAATAALLVSLLAFCLASGIAPLDLRAGDPFQAPEATPAPSVPLQTPPPSEPAP